MAFGSIVGALGSIYAASSAEDAAEEQADASRASVEEQRRQFNLLQENAEPYRSTGENALYEMSGMLGLGGREYHQTRNRLQNLRDRRSDVDKFTTEFDTGDYVQAYSRRTNPGDQGPGKLWYRKDETTTAPGVLSPAGGGLRATRGAEGLTTEELMSGTSENQRVTQEWKDINREIEALEGELQGLEPGQGQGSQYDISQTPGYQFRFDQGMEALNNSLASTGNRLSGRAVKGATRYGQGLASTEYQNRFNRLASLSGRGQASVQNTGAAGMQMAGNVGNALMAGGRAQAMGIAGKNQAIQGGIGNILSYRQNQQLLNQLGSPQGGSTGGSMGSYGVGTGSSPVAAYG